MYVNIFLYENSKLKKKKYRQRKQLRVNKHNPSSSNRTGLEWSLTTSGCFEKNVHSLPVCKWLVEKTSVKSVLKKVLHQKTLSWLLSFAGS